MQNRDISCAAATVLDVVCQHSMSTQLHDIYIYIYIQMYNTFAASLLLLQALSALTQSLSMVASRLPVISIAS